MKLARPQLRLLRSLRLARYIGLEIELSRPGDLDRIQRYSPVALDWVHDGSVTPGGIECVTSPMVGHQLLDGVNYLADAFSKHSSAVDESCGYHVHVQADSASGFDVLSLRRLILLYRRFEGVFYDLVREGRDLARLNPRGELKCYTRRWEWPDRWYEDLARLTRPRDIRRYLIESLYPRAERRWYHPRSGRLVEGINIPQVRRHKYEACRYFGLNLHTWWERGTVEFRHHEGTIDRERLLNWALWCGWFVEAASRLSDSQLGEVRTLQDLLLREWPGGGGRFLIPSGVAAYVLEGVAERRRVNDEKVAVAF